MPGVSAARVKPVQPQRRAEIFEVREQCHFARLAPALVPNPAIGNPAMSTPNPSDTSAATEQVRWFAEEVQPHESKLRTWLCGRFPALADLDDIVQEAYLRLIRAKSAGKVCRTKPYLFSTARNVVLDRFRRERVVPMERMAQPDELRVLDYSPDVRHAIALDEDLALLSEAIQALPERCREVLVLRKLSGLSQKEIAAKLGISENTVAAHASAGMRRCIEFFRERNLK
jgi:RNA polymerase sigma factor (sigma-70 family)